MWSHWRQAVLVALLIGALAPTGASAYRLCIEPISATQLPSPEAVAALPDAAQVRPLLSRSTPSETATWLTLLRGRFPPSTTQDRRYYWFHVALAGVLQAGRCDARASGVQWVKAAIHARSVSQAERVAGGIASVLAASAAPESVARELCLAASPRNWEDLDHVSLTFAMAGVYCGPGMAPARLLAAQRAGLQRAP